ncbi:hypothetical protein [uncultured Ruegeria sp.]|uniref:hypothetical protein n=1 Tax=uncultured Ruegeria sp. TaxID=259304 RepID=UPI0026151D0B|nr:hypothetical protein [uncultured Ruegeria sp.]
MSIRTRIGKLEKAAPIELESLSPEFFRDTSGELTAAELPQLGLARINRIDDEAESDFRQRVYFALVKARSGPAEPFYKRLDTPTLEACREALEAFISTHDPNLLAELKSNGDRDV